MNPWRFQPAYKDYLWGGQKLKTEYGKNSPLNPTAESWELSVHPDGPSVISEGEFAGKTLAEAIAEDPAVLGTARKSDELPILIKLIDAADNLSIQVHPDDAMARALEGQNGKTEMWYVVQADKGASIVYGMKEDVSPEIFAEAIESNTVLSLLNGVSSQKGMSFFVEAGTVHAIGKGNLIAEIQQNSNVTYRLYDYARRDKNGNLRELHVEKGTRAANLKKVNPRPNPLCSDGSRLLASCPFFQVREREIVGRFSGRVSAESYLCLICVGGDLTLDGRSFPKGETVFFPADSGNYSLEGTGTLLQVTHPPRYFAGVDLGGTNIAVAVVDEYGVIYGRARRKTRVPRPYEEIFDDMCACVWDAVSASGLLPEDVESVGVGCPGAVDPETGDLIFSNNLGFRDVPLRSYLEKALQKPVFIENDANAAAWGEFLAGCGADTSDFVMLTLGTGVGGGIVSQGRLLTGGWGNGAELGHMVICVDGEQCTCGRKGCLEAYASATALIRQTKEAMKEHPESTLWQDADGDLDNVNGKTVFDSSDPVALAVVDQYAEYLAEGVVNFVNIFQPQLIALGGGISASGDRLLPILQKAVDERSFPRFGKKNTKVVCATLGNDAGIIGAALLGK